MRVMNGKCSLVCAERSFYAPVNGVSGKPLNLILASEEVILELVRTKCTPILL